MPHPSIAAEAALSLPYGSLRIGPAASLPDLLRQFGVAPADLIAGVGLNPGVVDDPDNPVEMTALGRLLCACVTRTGCQHFGLLVDQQGGLASLGLVGLPARHSPDLATALRTTARYLHIHDRGGATPSSGRSSTRR